MFERFNDSARLSLFHARLEAGNLGALTIEPEHLLLGLLHDPQGIANEIFARAQLTRDGVHKLLEERGLSREKVKPEVEMPFSEPTKRVIDLAVAEADQAGQREIEPRHLLIGLLQASGTIAATVLADHHLTVDHVRRAIEPKIEN